MASPRSFIMGFCLLALLLLTGFHEQAEAKKHKCRKPNGKFRKCGGYSRKTISISLGGQKKLPKTPPCSTPYYPCSFYVAPASCPASFSAIPISASSWPPTSCVGGSPSAAETSALLAAKAAFQNPACLSGWTTSTPTCNWKYVCCTLVGGKPAVTTLGLGGLGLGGGKSTYNGPNPAWEGGNGVFGKPSRSQVSEGLTKPFAAGLSKLPYLTALDLSYNGFLNSPLPNTLPPALKTFYIDHSHVVGRIPTSYASQLTALSVERNMLVGPVPEIANFWGVQNYMHYRKPGSVVPDSAIAYNCLIGKNPGYVAPNQWTNPTKETDINDAGWLGNPCYLFCDIAIYPNQAEYPGPCLGNGFCIKGCSATFFKNGKCTEKLVSQGGKDPHSERQAVCHCDPGFYWHTDHKCTPN